MTDNKYTLITAIKEAKLDDVKKLLPTIERLETHHIKAACEKYDAQIGHIGMKLFSPETKIFSLVIEKAAKQGDGVIERFNAETNDRYKAEIEKRVAAAKAQITR